MYQGELNKARRGELSSTSPRSATSAPRRAASTSTPTSRSATSCRLIFDQFDELGTACGRVPVPGAPRHPRAGLRPHHGPDRGRLEWRSPIAHAPLPHPSSSHLHGCVCLRIQAPRSTAPRGPGRRRRSRPGSGGGLGGPDPRPPAGVHHLGSLPDEPAEARPESGALEGVGGPARGRRYSAACWYAGTAAAACGSSTPAAPVGIATAVSATSGAVGCRPAPASPVVSSMTWSAGRYSGPWSRRCSS